MEDQVERSPQIFQGNNCSSFNRDENKTIGALSSVNFEYSSGIKAAAWTLENKKLMVMYSISSNLNSPFNMIGKAAADKITAKCLGKTHAFAFA